jgi:hypothetical protein
MAEQRRRPALPLARWTAVGRLSQHAWPIVGFGLVTLLLFGAVLFRGDTRVLGHQTTDLYAQFIAWRAVTLPGSSQKSYDLMPANYVLRAVPLAAGQHRLRVEYAPAAFTVGLWVSVVARVGFIALSVVWWRGLQKA